MSSNTANTPTKKLDKSAKRTSVKASAKTAPKQKRETVASLTDKLRVLENRLKVTNKRNRIAVKALESVVADINGEDGYGTHKTVLASRLNALENRLETYLARSTSDAKAGIRTDLAAVTRPGADLATFENAIQSANARLDIMDETQRGALARINRHIADLAISIEHRLSGETQARKTATAALDTKINSVREHIDQRVDKVEEDTAKALEAVGEKVAQFATVLEQRAQTSDAQTAERLADLAQETQADLTAAQTDVEARLEALEVIAKAWSPHQNDKIANPYLPANEDDPRIDKMSDMIDRLQNQLGRLNLRLANAQNSEHNTQSDVNSEINNEALLTPRSATADIVPITADIPDNPYTAAAQALETTKVGVSEPQLNPNTPQLHASKTKSSDDHIPPQFNPAVFTPPQETPPPAYSSDIPGMITPPPLPSAMQTSGQQPVQISHAAEPYMPAPITVPTYNDPAYAEADDMRAERIGGTSPKRASRIKKPITGRNLKVGGVALGVAVVGLFAAKTILGTPGTGPIETRVAETQTNSAEAYATNSTQSAPNISRGVAAKPASIAPLGQYAETKTPSFSNDAENTLDAAVAAGNPIAQFQKGLVQLQSGQLEDGARLIRLAANRNQPAAQYRLAKLYETATGVQKDEITARELIDRAARGGNRIAMHDLGNYHALGQGGLEQDMATALDWFTKAAERGVVDSQFNVAYLREGNEGVAPDVETALFWYYVAARQGDQGAPDRVKILSANLDADTQAQIKSRADKFSPKPIDEAANGIFRNVAWAKTGTELSASNSAQILKIREAQTLLSKLGYPVGTPDGISGSKTRDAIKSFEAVNGLPETGHITDALMERLEVATGA